MHRYLIEATKVCLHLKFKIRFFVACLVQVWCW